MTDRVRLRSTAVLAVLLSLPTVRALVTYDIEAMTAALRILLAIAVAIAAVAVVGSVIGRVPPAHAQVTEGAGDVEDDDVVPPPEPRSFPPGPEPAGDEPPATF